MKTVVLATFGSLGDLHPYLAVGLALQDRGVRAIIATSATYRDRVEALGLGFHPVRPDLPDFGPVSAWIKQATHPTHGGEYVVRRLMLPHLMASAEDLMPAIAQADAVVSHMLTYTVPLIARKLDKPWASSALQPLVYFSRTDPPVLPLPWPLATLSKNWGPADYQRLFQLARWRTRPWVKPVNTLAQQLGIPSPGHPMFEGQYSPWLNLALFSHVLGDPQPDWPKHARQSGAPLLSQAPLPEAVASRLNQFLAGGPPPVVFTLGSSAVQDAGDFYAIATATAQALGLRAILLTGPDNPLLHESSPHHLALDYCPYEAVFPHAVAVVHQGGVGTTQQALKAGCPSVILPYGHDQPDNAHRVERLGAGLTLTRTQFSEKTLKQRLTQLLGQPTYRHSANQSAQTMAQEGNGADVAAQAIIEVLLNKQL